MTGTVFDIKEFAVFDGPGVRTTVFMKGCPLHCQWCHNPEGLSVYPQLMVSRAACVHCGACEKVCEHLDHCVSCGKCVPVCRGGLRKIIGTVWSSDALAERLLKDKFMFESCSGGVTFSGGEPLLQWPFVKEVIQKLGGVHTAIETSACTTDEIFQDAMTTCSFIMMDWKVTDPETHRRFTGVDNGPILRHLRMLCEGDTPFILRMPIIPGVNDNMEHFRFAAETVKNAKSLVRVELLPYQKAAGAKYEMVGLHYAPTFDEAKLPFITTLPFEEMGIPCERFK